MSTVISSFSTIHIYFLHRCIKVVYHPYLPCPPSYQAFQPSLSTLSTVVLSLPTILIIYLVYCRIKLAYYPYYLHCPPLYQACLPSLLSTLSTVISSLSTIIIYLVYRRINHVHHHYLPRLPSASIFPTVCITLVYHIIIRPDKTCTVDWALQISIAIPILIYLAYHLCICARYRLMALSP